MIILASDLNAAQTVSSWKLKQTTHPLPYKAHLYIVSDINSTFKDSLPIAVFEPPSVFCLLTYRNKRLLAIVFYHNIVLQH